MSLRDRLITTTVVLMIVGALILKYQMDDHFYRGAFFRTGLATER